MRYKRLPHPVFSDTLTAGTKSKRGNKYAQAYCTQYGWSRVHPMKRKSEAVETLSLVFKRDGVPPRVVVDNSKEQSLGKFRAKCLEADSHLVNTEPYSPWQQAAEGCVKHTKQASSNKMLKTGTPKPLWDHCIELQALIRSHTALDIFGLQGQVPETVMMSKTVDMNNLCEFE